METSRVLLNSGKSKLLCIENFASDVKADELFSLPLLFEPPIIVYGKKVHQRRNVGFFSDESEGYRFSGQIAKSQSLSDRPILQDLLKRVNDELKTHFNGVLVNEYKNGEKSIGAHSDDEKDLNKKGNNEVACIAFGATRKFRIRNKETKDIVLDYKHTSGTLLVMEGNFQKEYTHEIPVEKTIKEARISVTFRHHIS